MEMAVEKAAGLQRTVELQCIHYRHVTIKRYHSTAPKSVHENFSVEPSRRVPRCRFSISIISAPAVMEGRNKKPPRTRRL